jgi:hypothetical protein
MGTICVVKADGRRVPFDLGKVKATCVRAGASEALAEKIARSVLEQSRDGMSTREVYRLVLKALAASTSQPGLKHRYRLKESLMLMGPAGFAFESYVTQLLERHCYRVESIRSKVKGRCIEHEINLAAISPADRALVMVECKYHNLPGTQTGTKESLYTHARFLDVRELFDGEMLVTNTRVSDEALQYAGCVGQQVLSWRHPPGRGLEKLVEEKGLYPVTMLRLSAGELAAFARINFMIAAGLLDADLGQLSMQTGVPASRLAGLKEQARQILLT